MLIHCFDPLISTYIDWLIPPVGVRLFMLWPIPLARKKSTVSERRLIPTHFKILSETVDIRFIKMEAPVQWLL